MRRWLLAFCLLGLSSLGWSEEAKPLSDNPALEARMMSLASVLRCLVCQNQTIADSHADLAVDLRRQITEMMAAGKSDEEIKSYLVERYGDFVLYDPPFKATTVLLWLGPILLIVVGGGLLIRARRLPDSVPELSAESIEVARKRLLDSDKT